MAMDVPKLYVKFSIWIGILTERTDTLSTVYHNVNTQTTSWNQATHQGYQLCLQHKNLILRDHNSLYFK